MARNVTTDCVEFLRSHVDTSNIPVSFTKSEDIGYPAYDDVDQDVYVTPVSEDPTTPGGGETGYTGIDPGGDGGIQDTVVSLQLDCWGGELNAPVYDNTAEHPLTTASAVAQEVHRVLFNADEAAAGPPVPSGYEWVNAQPPTEAHDAQQDPTKYRYFVIARWKYTDTP